MLIEEYYVSVEYFDKKLRSRTKKQSQPLRQIHKYLGQLDKSKVNFNFFEQITSIR